MLEQELDKDLPVIQGDSSQIRQIVMNLITNASEAFEEKNGTITVSTGAKYYGPSDLSEYMTDMQLPEGVYVHVEVADTGCGMDTHTLNHVFDPFFTTKFTGRGLGMAAVLGIVHGHHGGIRLTSTPGQGSVFRVLLPVATSGSDLASGDDLLLSGAGKKEARILLVDDEDAVRDLSQKMIERLGYAVVTAVDGHDAIRVFEQEWHHIDLVFLDLTMPRMDGAEAFQALRRIDPQARVVVCSGFTQQEVAEKFHGQELAGFLQKPYSLRILKDFLDGWAANSAHDSEKS